MNAHVMPRTRWPRPRIFLLGMFVGRGLKAEEIADLLDSTVHMVRTMTNNMGGAFSDISRGNVMIDVPKSPLLALDAEARRRNRSTEAMLSQVATILGEDSTLLANVLDDVDE